MKEVTMLHGTRNYSDMMRTARIFTSAPVMVVAVNQPKFPLDQTPSPFVTASQKKACSFEHFRFQGTPPEENTQCFHLS